MNTKGIDIIFYFVLIYMFYCVVTVFLLGDTGSNKKNFEDKRRNDLDTLIGSLNNIEKDLKPKILKEFTDKTSKIINRDVKSIYDFKFDVLEIEKLLLKKYFIPDDLEENEIESNSVNSKNNDKVVLSSDDKEKIKIKMTLLLEDAILFFLKEKKTFDESKKHEYPYFNSYVGTVEKLLGDYKKNNEK